MTGVTGDPVTSSTSESPPDTSTTGPVACDQPQPPFDDCVCAPGCGQYQCINDVWSCECVSCGGTFPDTDTDADTGSSTTSPGTTNDTGAFEVDCSANPPVFPDDQFKPAACEKSEDCSLAFHQIDCCGTRTVWGIEKDEANDFALAEKMCTTQFPSCNCAPKPTVAEDGQSSDNDAVFQVECIENECRSLVP